MTAKNSTNYRIPFGVTTAICVAVVLFAFVGVAAAKGPVSATIIGPGLDRPVELSASADPEAVGALMQQTGIWSGTGDRPVPMAEAPRDLGPAHLLSWVNSGPPEMSEADRTIHQLLYLDAAGGPVIHTPVQKGLDGWGPGVTGWFAAPRGLLDTLVELGAPVSGAAVVEQGSVPRAGSAPQQSDGVPRGAFWYLGIAGLVAFGVVTALRARRPAALGEGPDRPLTRLRLEKGQHQRQQKEAND